MTRTRGSKITLVPVTGGEVPRTAAVTIDGAQVGPAIAHALAQALADALAVPVAVYMSGRRAPAGLYAPR